MSSIIKHKAGLIVLTFLLLSLDSRSATLTQLSSPNKQLSVTLDLDNKAQ